MSIRNTRKKAIQLISAELRRACLEEIARHGERVKEDELIVQSVRFDVFRKISLSELWEGREHVSFECYVPER